ncbi:MAG: Bro-N domain-containing protein [Candidatus Fonsibacter sp.]
MSEIVKLKFNNNAIACVVVNGDPWFKDKYIATLLVYADTKKAIAKHVSEDDRSTLQELMGGLPVPPPLGIAIELQ